MYRSELSVLKKAFLWGVLLAALGSGILCGSLAVTESDLPLPARLGLGSGFVFGLIWVVLIASVLRRGYMDLKQDYFRISAIVLVFTILFTIFCLIVAGFSPEKPQGLILVANGLVFLILASVHWISYKLESSELSTRERLLRIEMLLAELRESRQS